MKRKLSLALLATALLTTACTSNYGFTNKSPRPGLNNPVITTAQTTTHMNELAPAYGVIN